MRMRPPRTATRSVNVPPTSTPTRAPGRTVVASVMPLGYHAPWSLVLQFLSLPLCSLAVPVTSSPARTALVTGFEPYNGAGTNPSGAIARALDGSEIAGCQVVGRVLPVSAAAAAEAVRAA